MILDRRFNTSKFNIKKGVTLRMTLSIGYRLLQDGGYPTLPLLRSTIGVTRA